MPLLPVTADQITENASSQATTNKDSAIVTTASLTSAAGATHSLTLLSSQITANSLVHASVGNGTNTAGTPAIASITVTNGQAVIVIQNIHAANALNGTLKVAVVIFN